MARPLANAFNHIHKAIGGELLKLEAHAKSVDPNNPESVGGFAGHLGMLTGIQEAHSHEEENGLWPEIEKKMPGAAESFKFDHEGERKYFAEINAAMSQLQQGNGDKQAAADTLYRYCVALASHLIHHMAKEEALMHQPFADKLTKKRKGQIIYNTYEGLPEELVVRAMPWFASYQTPEDLVDDAAMLNRYVRPEKAQLILKSIVNSLPPEKWGEMEKLNPDLAQYKS